MRCFPNGNERVVVIFGIDHAQQHVLLNHDLIGSFLGSRFFGWHFARLPEKHLTVRISF